MTSVNSLLCRQAASGRQSAAHRHTLAFCLFLLKVLTFEDSVVFLLSASSVWIFVVAFLFFSYKKDLKYKEIQKGWLTYQQFTVFGSQGPGKLVDEPESAVRETLGLEAEQPCCSIAVRSHLLPTFHFIYGGISHRLLLGLMN